MLFYKSATNTWTFGPGWGALSDLCIADSSTYNLPAPRHPIEQMAVDTKRGRLYLVGSVNQSCQMNGPIATNGTTTVSDSSPEFVLAGGNWNGIQIEIPEGSNIRYTIDHVVDEQHLVTTKPVPAGSVSARVFPPENSQIEYPENKFDTWYLTLNANPATDTWTQVPVTRVPSAIEESAMTYDPNDDVLFLFGYDQGAATHDSWLFCSTDGNPGGTFTSAQLTAGCLYANDWSEVLVGGLPVSPQPPGYIYPGVVYDGNTQNVIQFGGCTGYPPGCTNQTDVWFYSVPNRTWTRQYSQNQPPATAMNIAPPAMALDTSTHTLLYHYLDSPNTADYVYDPTTNTWTKIGSSGVLPIWNSGCTGSCNVASGIATLYDPLSNMIIAWNEGNPSTSTLWQGALQTQYRLTTASSPSAGGTVTPASGTLYNSGSVVSVRATANAGYQFANFSGGALTGSTNPQNVTLNGPTNVVANFTPLTPNMAASVGARTVSGSRVLVSLTLTNTGLGAATNATIASITAISDIAGSGTVTVASGTPLDLGTINPKASATGTITFNWPSTATRVQLHRPFHSRRWLHRFEHNYDSTLRKTGDESLQNLLLRCMDRWICHVR